VCGPGGAGPLFVLVNKKIREAVKMLEDNMSAKRKAAGGTLALAEEDVILEKALGDVQAKLGRDFVTTIHAINSVRLPHSLSQPMLSSPPLPTHLRLCTASPHSS